MVTYDICKFDNYHFPIGILDGVKNPPSGIGEKKTFPKKEKKARITVKEWGLCQLGDECPYNSCPLLHSDSYCQYGLACEDPTCPMIHSDIQESNEDCPDGPECTVCHCPYQHPNEWCFQDGECQKYPCGDRHSVPMCPEFFSFSCPKYNECPMRHPLDILDKFNEGIECPYGKGECPYNCILFHSMTKEEIRELEKTLDQELKK